MTDIKELALKTLDAMAEDGLQVHNITYESGNTGVELDEPALDEFATRLIAAYLAEQKPVAWWGSMWIMGSGPNPFHTCKICGEKHPAVEIVLAEHAESHLFRAPPEPAPDWLLKTAQNLAQHMAKEFFPDVPQFEVLDDLAGVISQIDNMVCGLPREPILCAAPSSEEVDEVVERLRTYPTRQHLIAADLIERLAARVPDERIATLDRKVAELEQVISEHGADMWAQGEEYAALSAKCAQAQIKADAFEQQNAELVAALELCKKHMAGDKWDSLFIDGVLSKVKQP